MFVNSFYPGYQLKTPKNSLRSPIRSGQQTIFGSPARFNQPFYNPMIDSRRGTSIYGSNLKFNQQPNYFAQSGFSNVMQNNFAPILMLIQSILQFLNVKQPSLPLNNNNINSNDTKINQAKQLINDYIQEYPELNKLKDNLENTNISVVDGLPGKARTGYGKDGTKIEFNKTMVESVPSEVVATYLIHELTHADLHDLQNGKFKDKTNSQWEEAQAFEVGYKFWDDHKDVVKVDNNNKYIKTLNQVSEQYYKTGSLDEYAGIKYKDLPENPQQR